MMKKYCMGLIECKINGICASCYVNVYVRIVRFILYNN